MRNDGKLLQSTKYNEAPKLTHVNVKFIFYIKLIKATILFIKMKLSLMSCQVGSIYLSLWSVERFRYPSKRICLLFFQK